MDTVSHTLFYPLFGRAQAAHNWPELFQDPWAIKAEEIGKAEGTPAKAMEGFPVAVYGIRHQITVFEAKRYLREHPGAAIINIGCGLDTLTLDLKDEDCTIYNLDLPEVIEARSRWITKAPNEHDLPYSATDHTWMNHVDNTNGMFAIAAGVMYYLQVEEGKALIAEMAKRFPGGRFSFDNESPTVIGFSEKSIAKQGTPCAMPFRIKDPYEPKTWSDRITNYEIEFNLLNYLPPSQRKALPLGHRIGFGFFEKIKGMYQVNMDFAD